MAKRRDEAVVEDVRWAGPEPLRALLVPIDGLHEDPANVNTHDERSVAAIAASYARFGQQKPVVADVAGVVRAGNGQLAAARRLGWTHLAAVASDLAGADLMAFSLADNRVAQLAEFDYEGLTAQLRALQAEGSPIGDLGWSDHELEPLLAAEWAPAPVAEMPAADGVGPLGDGNGSGGAASDGGDHPRPILVDAAQRAAFDEASAAVREEADDPEMGEGECLAVICREYLGR